MNRAAIVDVLENGVRESRGAYDSQTRRLIFPENGTISLDCFAQQGDDMSGINTYEHSNAAIPPDLLDEAITQAMETGRGCLEYPVTLFQNFYGHDEYAEFDTYDQVDVKLRILIECREERVMIGISRTALPNEERTVQLSIGSDVQRHTPLNPALGSVCEQFAIE